MTRNCVFRYGSSTNAGGNKEFLFFTSFIDYERQVNELEPRTCLIVFHDKQLPLRGIVNEEFIDKALAMVQDGDEYLLVGLTLTVIGAASWYSYHAGESHEELLEDLHDEIGHLMAFGSYPEWPYDSETEIGRAHV